MPETWFSDAKKRDMESFGAIVEVSEDQLRKLSADSRVGINQRLQSYQNRCQSLHEWLAR